MLKLYLIRHGMTKGNKEKRYLGSTDEPLCPEGRASAKRMASYQLFGDVQTVITSPMLRCKETADILLPSLPRRVSLDLRENDFGVFEYKGYTELSGQPDFDAWIAGDGMTAPPEGESRPDFTARCARAFDTAVRELLATHVSVAAFVIHGGTIMGLLSHYVRPKRPFFDWWVDNCGCYAVQIDERVWPKGLTVLQRVEGA